MIRVLPLLPGKNDNVLNFVCREFVQGSVLHRATKVSLENYVEYMRCPFRDMVADGMSFVVVDSIDEKPVGCILACDYLTTTDSDVPAPREVEPISALLKTLEAPFEAQHSIVRGQVLKVDIAVVTKAAQRKGVYTRLRECVHARGIELGYASVVGELTSQATQTLCVDGFKHQVRNEIAYKDFVFEERYPFSSITSPDSVQLVEGLLRQQ